MEAMRYTCSSLVPQRALFLLMLLLFLPWDVNRIADQH
jgi:hypothetical protein